MAETNKKIYILVLFNVCINVCTYIHKHIASTDVDEMQYAQARPSIKTHKKSHEDNKQI